MVETVQNEKKTAHSAAGIRYQYHTTHIELINF